MKQHILGIFVCCMMVAGITIPVVGTFNGPAQGKDASDSSHLVSESGDSTSFRCSIVETKAGHVKIMVENTSAYLSQPGSPLIPKIVYHYELPFGVTNIGVNVTVPGYHKETLGQDIVPATAPRPYSISHREVPAGFHKNAEIYGSSQPYPARWFSYHAGCGLNNTGHRVTHVTVEVYPVRYRPADDTIMVAASTSIHISYDEAEAPLSIAADGYDLVIVSPSVFAGELERLVEHKNSHGVDARLKTTEEIYREYEGMDRPEQIKYFIKDAIKRWNTTYVLLVGGLQSLVYGTPRDTPNAGTADWHLPVRYSNLRDEYQGDPGFLCDLYFADVYTVGGAFDDWDSNNDGIIAARNYPGATDDVLDLYPDVYVGRLPCRNSREISACVDKIITYENTAAGSDWFKRIVAVAGDGLQDQEDLDIQWNVSELPSGKYTIYAQSRSNITGEWGPIDEVTVTVDHQRASSLHFSEDDHLRIDSYPGPAIAEITSPSDGDVLGTADVDFTPSQAYMGSLWANVTYIDGVMHIRGKSYDLNSR